MTGIIIAGGAGTRLRPLTNARPKPMMPIAGKPLLQYQVELLRRHGVDDIVLAVGRDVEAIRYHFGDGNAFGVHIVYSVEPEPLGTAGAVRYAEPQMGDETAIVLNGDSIMDHDLSAMVRFNVDLDADATIGLVEVPAPSPCGVVMTNGESRVISFEEPTQDVKELLSAGPTEVTGTATVNGGVYVISRDSLKRVPFGANWSMERDFFPTLIKAGCRVYGFPLRGYWLDIGSPANYLQAHHDLLAGRACVQINGQRTPDGYWADTNSTIDPSARIESGVFIGSGCRIGPDTSVTGNASIGSGCVIAGGCILDGCVLLENVRVGSECTLRNCIVDRDSIIGEQIRLLDNSIVAAGSTLTEIAPRAAVEIRSGKS